jgi:hypothetical protein
MCAGCPTAGSSSSCLSRPDNEFETDRRQGAPAEELRERRHEIEREWEREKVKKPHENGAKPDDK